MSAQLDNDPVHHPAHYTSGKVECIDAIEAALGLEGFISFLRGQIVKYTWRLEHKHDAVQDAEKAQWYNLKLIQKLRERKLINQGVTLTDKGNSHDRSSKSVHIPDSTFIAKAADIQLHGIRTNDFNSHETW